MNILISLRTSLARSALALAAAGLLLLPTASFAQEKGAERLTKLNRIQTVEDVKAVEAGDLVVMSCPKCKDSWVKVAQPPGKMGRPETASIQRHECPGCSTTIATVGAGKPAKNKVVHVCKQCGSKAAFCCVIKKASGPTAGMEEHKDPKP